MCGITGFVGLQDKQLLERMTAALAHRGPDDLGYYFKGSTGLGHRRLSIIDLKTGRQPISNEEKNIWVILNGEIFNYKELKEGCLLRGHAFYTNSDTEVLVHLYEDFGVEFLKQLNGCFAIAIWDERKKKLLLARDRLGIRPLYYLVKPEAIVFSSEIKSFLAGGLLERKIDYSALSDYFTLRYLLPNRPLFRGINILRPATYLTFSFGKIELNEYWDVSFGCSDNTDTNSFIEKFRFLLEDSVRLRLLSDVRVGAYLSGGVDSGALVALMSRNSKDTVRTFSLGFGTEKDELVEAARLAGYLKTQHHEIMLDRGAYKLLPEIIRFTENPIGDPIIIPTYVLAQNVSRHVKVVLSGEGADEILGGYIHHFAIFYLNILIRRLPSFLRRAASKVLEGVHPSFLNRLFIYPADLGFSGRNRIAKYLSGNYRNQEAYLILTSLFTQEEKEKLFSRDFYYEYIAPFKNQTADYFDNFFNRNGISSFDDLLSFDLKNWLPAYTLLKQDSLSMANSLEARVPYLDHRLVELCAKLPTNLRFRGLNIKYILRKTAEQYLPKKDAWRQKKSFYAPVLRCFDKKFLGFIRDYLNEGSIKKRGIFDYSYVEKLLSKFERSELLEEKKIMSLLILELWFREFVDSYEKT